MSHGNFIIQILIQLLFKRHFVMHILKEKLLYIAYSQHKQTDIFETMHFKNLLTLTLNLKFLEISVPVLKNSVKKDFFHTES